MFENQLFDQWLNQKSLETLSKIDKNGQITTEDMLILTLKAQTNHFHHMDMEFRDEFKNMKERFTNVDAKIDLLENKIDKKLDNKFESLYTNLRWGFGLLGTSIFAMLLKMFLA